MGRATGQPHVPKSLQTLVQGRSRILLVKLHEVGALAPEEDWLRANASMVNQKPIQMIELIDFSLKQALRSEKYRRLPQQSHTGEVGGGNPTDRSPSIRINLEFKVKKARVKPPGATL